MANTPPPFTPPSAQASATSTCQWCSKPMTGDAVRCASCGKLRKDIYNEKIICYLFSLSAGLCLAISIATWKKKQSMGDFNYFDGGGGGSSNNTLSVVLLVMGIIAAIATTYYYIRVSKKMKTYWWM